MPTILCIEDEPDLRETLIEVLQDAGYRTLEAGDGPGGMQALLQHKPDLVLCDVRMPGQDGHALLSEVRAHPELAEIPFVFLSGLASKSDIVQGKRLGADDYITKPVDFDLLTATIESRLRQIKRLQSSRDEKMVKLYRRLAQGREDDAADAPAAAPPAPVSRSDSAAGTAIAQLARDNHGSVTVGRMQMVGLQAVREELGPRWHELAKKVLAIAETLINERLTPEDVLTRSADGEFVICFASLSKEEAAFKAKAIERELVEQILGNQSVGRLSRMLSPSFDVARLADVASEAHTVEIAPAELEGNVDLAGLLIAKMQHAAANAAARAGAILKGLRETCGFAPRPVCLRNGTTTRLRLLDFDPATASQMSQLRRLAAARDEHLLAELDLVVLTGALEAMYGALHEEPDVVAIPLSFATLKTHQWSSQVFRACSVINSTMVQRVAFRVSGFPISEFSGFFIEKLRLLQRHCRFTILDLERPAIGNVSVRGLRVSLVSMSYANYTAQMQSNVTRMDLFVKKLHGSGARLIIDQVPAVQAESLGAHCPADFISIGRA